MHITGRPSLLSCFIKANHTCQMAQNPEISLQSSSLLLQGCISFCLNVAGWLVLHLCAPVGLSDKSLKRIVNYWHAWSENAPDCLFKLVNSVQQFTTLFCVFCLEEVNFSMGRIPDSSDGAFLCVFPVPQQAQLLI